MRKRRNKLGTTIITSGDYRGEKILTPGGDIHPMGSREKIALFNMIADYLPGAFVLDAYAGSGALGIEALSRGAAFVLFTDINPTAIRVIKENMEELGLYGPHGGPILKDILEEAATATDRFSIVLADPPYEGYRPEMVTELRNMVAEGGLLVTSTPEEVGEIEGMMRLKNKKYARAHIAVYEQLTDEGERVRFPRMYEEI